MSTHKSIKPELKARLEKALRENLRKRKAQQRDRKDTEEVISPVIAILKSER